MIGRIWGPIMRLSPKVPLYLDCQIIFNDKRQYTNCRHMGKNDIYFLDLSFIIKRIDSINYQILDFTWKETVHMGAI